MKECDSECQQDFQDEIDRQERERQAWQDEEERLA
jgi:hypothetical protein